MKPYQKRSTEIFHYKRITVVFLLLVQVTVFGQVQQLVDSLKGVLPSVSGEVKAKVLADLCWYNRGLNPLDAAKFGRQALNYSQEINYQKGVAQAYNDLGILKIDKGANDFALQLFDSSLTIRKELKDTLGIAALYNKIGIVHQNQRNLTKALEAQLAALKIYEERDMANYEAYCLNNIAILYHDQNNEEKSIQYHK